MRFLISLLAALAFVAGAVFLYQNMPEPAPAPVAPPVVVDHTPPPPPPTPPPVVPAKPAEPELPKIASLEVRDFKDATGRVLKGTLVSVQEDGRFYIQLETKKFWACAYTRDTEEQSLYVRGALASFPELSQPKAIPEAAYRQGYRFLASNEGSVIIAKVLNLAGEQVKLVTSDSKEFTVPLSQFCPQDRDIITTLSQPAPPATPASGTPSKLDDDEGDKKPAEITPEVKKINELIGQDLFADTNLWDDYPKSAARRLHWGTESETNRDVSFRTYPPTSYTFLGASPNSAALYGSTAGITGVSLVYANKGDTFRSAGVAAEHFLNRDKGDPKTDTKLLKSLIKADEDALEKALTGTLGEPVRQLFGEGQSKRRVSRWDWKGHAFLLSAEEGEFVALAIEPSAVADARGKTARTADSEVRQRLAGNVERRPNGDVFINNIPMVDQGPKGYCVPATFERVMRYCDIQADMYLLAMIGETGNGGGTNVKNLAENLTRDIRAKGRNVDELKGMKMDPDKLAKYINDGIPVLWTLHSTKLFNSLATSHTAERKNKTPDQWKILAKKYAQSADDLKDAAEHNHIVIIVGYNKETNEIAFSDSWGASFVERWITASEAQLVSMGDFLVIRP